STAPEQTRQSSRDGNESSGLTKSASLTNAGKPEINQTSESARPTPLHPNLRTSSSNLRGRALRGLTTQYQNHMRLSRKRNFRSWTSETSRLAHEAKARKRMDNPPDRIERPEPGMLLHTIRVESHVAWIGFEIKVRQGERLNQIVAETFGRSSDPHGVDWLTRHLRERLVTRWIHV
ncbi:MAG: hypothetical protein ACLPYZ_10280, partial [Limisphaerales bacterium]